MSTGLEVTNLNQESRGRLGARLRAIALVLIGLGVIGAFTPRVARVYAVSSDDATGVLEADAVLRGNVLLRGWTLSNVAFTTTDLPFYVAGAASNGMRASLLRDVPVAVYMAAVAVGALLARGHGRERNGRVVLGMAAALVMLCLPAGGLAEFVTKGYIRVGTTLGVFVALLALDVPEGKRVGAGRVALFAVFLTLTLVADSLALVLGVLPVVLVCALSAFSQLLSRAVQRQADARAARWSAAANRTPGEASASLAWPGDPSRSEGRPWSAARGGINYLVVLFAAVGSVVAARGISWLIERGGGYRVARGDLLQFLAYRNTLWVVSRNVISLVENLSTLYRFEFPVELNARYVVVSLGCLIGPVFLCWAFFRGVPGVGRRRPGDGMGGADFVGRVLWCSVAFCLLAYLASSIPKDRATARYLVPFFLFGAVLIGRVVADRSRRVRFVVIAIVVLGFAYAGTVWDDLRKPPARDHAIELANALAKLGLRHGYGPFWDASIVTVSSGGRVTVRPIFVRPISPERHAIAPLPWMTDANWFREEPGTFVVFEPGAGAPYQFGVDERACVATFGPAPRRYEVGPYVVLVWGTDLRKGIEIDGARGQSRGRP